MPTFPLIEAGALAGRLDDPDWVIVDCRFSLTDAAAGRAAYERAHIPGARHVDLDRDLSRPPAPQEGRHPLPTRAAFATRLGRLGIANDTTVVAYDETDGAIAARLWWLLARWLGHERALVLNGGFAAWRALALPVEAGQAANAPQVYELRFSAAPAAVVTTAELASGTVPFGACAAGLLVDVRTAARYRGEQEPLDPVAGHVPGAVNRPYATSLEPDGRFRPPEVLRPELEALLGERRPSELVAMCGSGVTACHLLLAMAAAGLDGGRLYAGSWSEWIRDPERPVASGPEP
jgi:thiosulfate/3-mercaptopyruvate sulfurtransferase